MMIKGDADNFAIESMIHEVFPKESLMALGSFLIHVAGKTYGVSSPTATMLACSFDSVRRRIANRGKHKADFSQEQSQKIVDRYLKLYYADSAEKDAASTFDYESCRFQIESNDLVMAPDGDAAFDDLSHVLQFDLGEKVRIIAFRNCPNKSETFESISELVLDEKVFYSVLESWAISFAKEREGLLDRGL